MQRIVLNLWLSESAMSKLVTAFIFALIVHSAVSPASAQSPANTDDVAAGQALALELCWACHVVAPEEEFPPILHQPAPSFAAIADLSPKAHPSMGRIRSSLSLPPTLDHPHS